MENNMDVFPKLETERLTLESIDDSHVEDLHKYWSDEKVTEFMDIDNFTDIDETKKMINLLNHLYSQGKAIRWGIYRKEDNAIIGSCGYNSGLEEGMTTGEIGYEIGREYWGKGYMEEALRAIIDYGFEKLNLNRIEAYVAKDNEKSLKLIYKLGFKKEGLLRGKGFYKGRFWDEFIFALIKDEWGKNQISKVLFHVDEKEKLDLGFKNIKNLLNDLGEENTYIEMVVNGEAVEELRKEEFKYDNILNEIISSRVKIVACQNSLNAMEIKNEDLIESIFIVPSGVGELARKQINGWAYIRP
ncbi:GNAT family N-acetyltransferase [Clostridium sp. MSJ-11]|uniref:GNAT family N-acetyltransferase n=1 Tax=Clostridium mobile TaxID=2841512 RepID=A0ABS6EGH7_9CLOT|nr:GNAT family N-acetyltransferase [Clostridium mobile]MBU5483580.1 GNAT family N-acetyltransferase [Clostridium mobile]